MKVYDIKIPRRNFVKTWLRLFYGRKAFTAFYWKTLCTHDLLTIHAMNWSDDQYIVVQAVRRERRDDHTGVVALAAPAYLRYGQVEIPEVAFLNLQSGQTFDLPWWQIDLECRKAYKW